MSNPLDPIAKLRDRVARVVASRGLVLQDFVVRPGAVGGPHRCQVVLTIDEDWKPNEEPTIDDPEFQRVIEEAEKAEREQLAQRAREGLQSLRDDLADPRGGIGLD